MFYLDASILVTALVNEPSSQAVQRWLSEQEAETVATSHWSITEFSSAMALKLRTGQISADQRATALAEFRYSATQIMVVLSVSASCFDLAARFADSHESGLRDGDALHLAIASENGAVLCTRDRRQADAGLALGVATKLL